jgi:Holliday junction resolvase
LATVTNSLTAAVIKYLELEGHYASRVQSQGQYSAKRGRWIKSTVKRGIGDIIACINGHFVMIEIKTGKDRQSEWQKQTERQVIKAGGKYWIIKEIRQFVDQYQILLKK